MWRWLRILLLALPCSVAMAAGWSVAEHEEGLTIYTRSVPGQDLKDFRGVLRVKAPMRDVVNALLDIENMPAWFFHMSEARFLDIDGPQQGYFYFVIQGFWPVSDRDAVVRVQVSQDPKTLVLTLAGTAAPDHYPLMRNRVRIPRLQSGWTVTPVSANETEVRLDGQADPGGYIPVWLANMLVLEMPASSLTKLRARLEGKERQRDMSADPRVRKLLGTVKFPE